MKKGFLNWKWMFKIVLKSHKKQGDKRDLRPVMDIYTDVVY